ncbi:conserved hypothetical protein [Rubrivivax sp. A210]|uniref:hypothetical protein n=1 Tax=Rubrivivax sp. A210 TaxID=2772301 RepID=UPI001919663F|nr:hypothetical protein [Rubrivivax sp. A210]CAD5373897.1 conserved hypothetical protein [Rubrivivax sp. A210]
MNQVALPLPLPHPAPVVADRAGFDIGWDHAHLGLVPAAGLLQQGGAVCQGWMAGKAVFGRRVPASSRATRQWLQLRLRAWQEAATLDADEVTPEVVARLQATHCPVLRLPLGGAANQPDAAVIEPLAPAAAWAAGRLATLSRRAAKAWDGLDVDALWRRARAAQLGCTEVDGLDAGAWWRLTALRAFATPLHFATATRLPLALLPPPGVELCNPVQRLQLRVTSLFLKPGWAARCRGLAERLPEQALRHDFLFFVGALTPRVLEAGSDPHTLGQALEDAWLLERVQRRWQHFVLSLGEVRCAALLQEMADQGRAATPAPLRRPAALRISQPELLAA